MSCMMRRHADALDGRNERVLGDAGILGDHLSSTAAIACCRGGGSRMLAVVEGLHRFIAGTARGEKHDGRGQMFIAESDDQINRMDRGRHAVSFPLR